MICKSVLLTPAIAMLTFSTLGSAQTQEIGYNSAIEVARANSRAERANIVGTAMSLSDKEASAFWPIYRQYEDERSTLEDSRVAVIKEYADKYPNLTDAEAKGMAERMFDYESPLTALKKNLFQEVQQGAARAYGDEICSIGPPYRLVGRHESGVWSSSAHSSAGYHSHSTACH